MQRDERSKVDRELRKLGFGGLDDPNLVTQIAFCIQNHDQFRRQLFSVEPEKRRFAYNILRPHLRFAAKPLDVYESEMKELAERHQLPTWDGSAYQKPFTSARISELAQEAIKQSAHEAGGRVLKIVCAKCTYFQNFPALERKQADRDANRAGWRSDGEKSWCPEHVPTRLTMTLACQDCEQEERIRAWDQQDGYAAARLRGWIIEAAATCPKCALKKLITQ